MDDQKLNFKNNITMGKQIKTLKFKKTRRSWIIVIGKIVRTKHNGNRIVWFIWKLQKSLITIYAECDDNLDNQIFSLGTVLRFYINLKLLYLTQ